MQRLAARERAEGVGRVLGALLPDVELAELLVDAELVALRAVASSMYSGMRLGALQVREADAGDAEGVLDQLAVGAASGRRGLDAAFALLAGELEVEHGEERAQARPRAGPA